MIAGILISLIILSVGLGAAIMKRRESSANKADGAGSNEKMIGALEKVTIGETSLSTSKENPVYGDDAYADIYSAIEENDGLYMRVVGVEDEGLYTAAEGTLPDFNTVEDLELHAAVMRAKEHCKGKFDQPLAKAIAFAANFKAIPHNLTQPNVATIHIYTQETNLYKGMNGSLGGWAKDGHAGIPAYLPYIKLLKSVRDIVFC
jgi:hypothetical protein